MRASLLVLIHVTCLCGASAAAAQCYGLADFDFAFHGKGSGTLTATLLKVVGNDDDSGIFNDTYYSGVAPADGLLTYDWQYASEDSDCFDYAYERVDGVEFVLSCNQPAASGSRSIPLLEGDALDLGVYSEDSLFGPGTLVVTNFCLKQPCVADIDGDGVVCQSDLGILLAAYASCEGDPDWNPAADVSPTQPAGCPPGVPGVDQSDLGVLLAQYARCGECS